MEAVRQRGFFKRSKFQLLVWFGGPICVILSNVVPIGQTVAQISLFLEFQDGGMVAYAILDFLNFKFVTVRTVDKGRTASPCHISWPSVKLLPRYRDFFDFSKMAAVRHLGYVMQRAFDSLYQCAKFDWNRCSSFDIMHVFRSHEFGLKTPIHAPKLFFFCFFAPLNGEPCEQILKRHILARVRVVCAIMRENPSTGLTCRWVRPKSGINKNNFGYISPMCSEAPRGRIYT